MRQFNSQLAGADFVPLGEWTPQPQTLLPAFSWEARDLLVVDDATDEMQIIAQADPAQLLDRLGGTIYSRLNDQLTRALAPRPLPTARYLLLDLAMLSHATPQATVAGLMGLAVVTAKGQAFTSTALPGVVSQAVCWLRETGLTEHQLFQPIGEATLRRLYQQLFQQPAACDQQRPCHTRAEKLTHDTVALLQGQIQTLKLPVSWQLLRAASLEQTVN